MSGQHSVGKANAQPKPCHHDWALARKVFAFRPRNWFATVTSTALAVLREIFDENAYARFLARHRMTNTRESYALYLRESNLTRERRPRCC